MTGFRLLADDLTGALDSACRFVGRLGPIPVGWEDDGSAPALALDSTTRDMPADAAEQAMARLAPVLAGSDFAFKKIDSLLRGHVAAELSICLRAGGFESVVLAPAFPQQGRITSNGRQLAHGSDTGVDLVSDLRGLGLPVTLRRPGESLPEGVSLWDAESDADLAAIAALRGGRILWCGTGGLAGALGKPKLLTEFALPGPVLALIGSNHPGSAAQLAQCRLRLTLSGPQDTRLPAPGTAVDAGVPPGTSREAAAEWIARSFAALAGRMERPGSLVVSGGETLRALCHALSATGLMVQGELAPGVPVSTLIGGRWPGLPVVSKSGAFGDAGMLARLLEGNPLA